MQYGGAYNIDSTNNGYTDVLKRVNGRLQRETENMHIVASPENSQNIILKIDPL